MRDMLLVDGPAVLMKQLSKRELEVVSLLAQGYRREDVARLCDISLLTVRNHITKAIWKVGVKNHTQLVVIYMLWNGRRVSDGI